VIVSLRVKAKVGEVDEDKLLVSVPIAVSESVSVSVNETEVEGVPVIVFERDKSDVIEMLDVPSLVALAVGLNPVLV
jgi:hypothetical protein